MLTPIAKSWPSEFCLEANSLAIQIHGGYGYTRDFPVEQYWRDNRLNMIHEGTHGIQAMDLLGRKVIMEGGNGLQLLATRINTTIQMALQRQQLACYANQLARALAEVGARPSRLGPRATRKKRWPMPCPICRPSAMWCWPGSGSMWAGRAGQDTDLAIAAHRGSMAAQRYFFHYELPRIGAWLQVVKSRDMTCANLEEEAF